MHNYSQTVVSLMALRPGRIGIWKCWFLWREENLSTRRKTLGARTRTNNKLNPHMTPRPGIEPGPHWWKVSALTTAPCLPRPPPPPPGRPWAREWRDSAEPRLMDAECHEVSVAKIMEHSNSRTKYSNITCSG